MFTRPSCVDEHIHVLLEEIYSILESVKKHQLRISSAQCQSMEELIKVLGRLVEKQSKMLQEVMIGNRTRQLHYEATLNVLAEQQRQVLELLTKWSENSFISISS